MAEARAAVREMVATLDDRWTRLISAEELALTAGRYIDAGSADASDGVELLTADTTGGRKLALLRVARISKGTPGRVRAALAGLSTPPDELWIDLRGNLGGSFSAAVEIAGIFLAREQRIVAVRRRNGPLEVFNALEDGNTEMPLHLLVDRNTASAAEVLVGALRDNDRADLRGERTYGKGVIQTVVKLSDGSALEVTVARYETPSGRSINKSGFEPDVQLSSCAAQLPASESTSRAEAERGLVLSVRESSSAK
ncbi:ClpP/crotonase-like domain-containing protein [Pavlovales sp. CCMP2436]|nr:ClpP/crotonase-like domain-containing protein [Pavlovales sp. CCMP2436]